ncbi:MAG TPA: class I SAM-dependent methyltransferase [Candidatus Tectomicrobia bacterium]|nr:class I SAM-dependent methyltransferase [Candidatus Tectomicrobia bacterium]
MRSRWRIAHAAPGSATTHRRAPALLLALVVLAALGCAGQRHGHHEHQFRDAERWARVFDDPARDAWQKPDEVVRALAMPADAVVADIGAGTGYFAVRLARAVPRGHVYAADLEPDMVRYLADRARREGLANLSAVQAAPADARLPRPVDVALVVNTYHHIADRPGYFRGLQTSLRPGGRVAIVDFLPDAPAGPPREARIPAAVVKEEMGRAGYGLVAEHTFLPYQYFLVFARQ